jgi:hypothetical protein
MKTLDSHIEMALDFYCKNVQSHFQCPVVAYVGQIHPGVQESFVTAIESIANGRTKQDPPFEQPDRLVVVLTTGGGTVETVEKMVEVIRTFFGEVFFIVPTMAMSAGTIFCMSGDRIYMDYASSLGPVDPQVQNPDGYLVPALGYLDKVNELINISTSRKLSDAELIMLQRLDLATLRRYEQARDLSISLLKEWLVQFKFKDWVTHRTNNPGTPVTPAEKAARAEQIARDLSDNKHWHSHGRMIGIKTLTSGLKLEVEDYTNDLALRENLRAYSGLLTDFLEKRRIPVLIHHQVK